MRVGTPSSRKLEEALKHVRIANVVVFIEILITQDKEHCPISLVLLLAPNHGWNEHSRCRFVELMGQLVGTVVGPYPNRSCNADQELAAPPMGVLSTDVSRVPTNEEDTLEAEPLMDGRWHHQQPI